MTRNQFCLWFTDEFRPIQSSIHIRIHVRFTYELSTNWVPSQSSIHGRIRFTANIVFDCQPIGCQVSLRFMYKITSDSRTNCQPIGCQVSLQFTYKFTSDSRIIGWKIFLKNYLEMKSLNCKDCELLIWSPALYLSILQMTINLKPNRLLCMWITLPFVKQLPVLKKRRIQVWMILRFCFPIWIPVLHLSNLPSHSNSAKCIKG